MLSKIAGLPAGIYLFKASDGSKSKICGICSKLAIKTPERRHGHRSDVFISNFEQISHIALMLTLLSLNK